MSPASRRRKPSPKKTFVLDTNVLLHSAASIESFADNDVVIPMAVIEELDKFKKNSDELGRNARQVIRHLDALRVSPPYRPGRLHDGVPLSAISGLATGNLFVISAGDIDSEELSERVNGVFNSDLGGNSPDNRILRVACALNWMDRNVVFISKDINLRLKADALGLQVMDYERGKVDSSSLYSGFVGIPVKNGAVEKLYHDSLKPPRGLELFPNEFAILTPEDSAKRPAPARLLPGRKTFTPISPRADRAWNVSPRNIEQRMALELLLDPSIRLVTLVGGAGTGKTLMALAAGLQQVLGSDAIYDRMLVSRPIIPLGNDIGFLPGDKGAKLASWMQPIFDNMDFLLGGDDNRKTRGSSHYSTEGLINSHKLELEALTYIRGRSIPRQFVVVDEAQNLTPHEVKTIISRCGEDTKMVLTGDPRQIDNPYLDSASNGLSFTVERMKEQRLFGHVTLAHSERSELSALAAKLL